jgi:hypothetical protein
MRELLVQQKTVAIALCSFMPASESLQPDSMQNMVSRSFLLSLWWKELTCLAVFLCLVLVITARLALIKSRLERPAGDPSPAGLAERIEEVAEQR